VHGSGVVEVHATGGVLPAGIEGEPVDRLPIRAALDPLQNHHHRHDHRWHRAAADVGEQVSEHLIREQRKDSRSKIP
jgi:hypothetical protein